MSGGGAVDAGPGEPDVVVVGGGPAGSTTAGLLAARGWRVIVLDRARFPRPKACGECINPGGVRALERLGLLDVVRALEPVPLAGWDVETAAGRRTVGRFGPGTPAALAVARSRLDAALLARARERGARVREGVRVQEVREAEGKHGPGVRFRDSGGREGRIDARVVVGADGLRSVTARCLGPAAGPDRTRKVSLTLRLRGDGPATDRGRLVLGPEGTVGLAPVGPSLWNATVVVSSDARGRDLAADPLGFALDFVTRRVTDWERPPVPVGGPWASGNFDFRVRRVAGRGVLLVGDAAGYYDPLTGQGIYRALLSAELAAAAIDTALREGRVSGRGLAPYGRRLRGALAPGRRVQRVVEAVVSRGPARELVVGRLGRAPGAMDALVRVTGDARPVRSLLRPSAWTPLLRPGTRRPDPLLESSGP